jgi:glutathione S-transferase
MSLVLYYGSGSPFAWRVQLALEHKALPYERKVLSFGDARTRALVRRLISEVDSYFDKAVDPVIEQAFYTKSEARDAAKLAAGRQGVIDEYALFTKAMAGDFLAGALSAADYAFYPLVAFMNRCEVKLPDLDANGMLTPELRAWKARMDALPYMEKTYPPHWKQQ